MKSYTIKNLASKDYSLAPKVIFDQLPWGGTYHPECYAQLIFVQNEGFYAKLFAKEQNPRTTYTNYYDPVCKDSCLEWFVNFKPQMDNLYINCEANSRGTLLCGVGTGRHGRIPIDQLTGGMLPEVQSGREGEYWWVEYFLSLDLLKKVFGEINLNSGAEYRANFYKCGDDTEIEHYVTWSPINVLPYPDYHCPNQFGKLILE
jgi:hypothetical protein